MTTFMVLGGVLIAFLVAVMPAAPASGTPSPVATEPGAGPAPALDATESPVPDPSGEETGATRIVAVAALAAAILGAVGFLLLRRRPRKSA
ncbi:MAG TPA: LPXTG cell wall anchor domain-containing protein [Kribbella sp.]|nr:LPXTG cell wall anchor domain-containing protein [Kribbella sp.]